MDAHASEQRTIKILLTHHHDLWADLQSPLPKFLNALRVYADILQKLFNWVYVLFCTYIDVHSKVLKYKRNTVRHTAEQMRPAPSRTWLLPLNPDDGSLNNKVRYFAHLLCSCSHSVYYVKELSWSQGSKSNVSTLTFYSELCMTETKYADCKSAESRKMTSLFNRKHSRKRLKFQVAALLNTYILYYTRQSS